MAYESYKNSKNKFQKIWEKSQSNSNEIENTLKTFQIDFSSVNFSKKITTVPIFTEKFSEVFLSEIFVVDLINIPEWIINHINIIPIVSLASNDNGEASDINTDTVFSGQYPDNLKAGDIGFHTEGKHWIATLNNNSYQLKIEMTIVIQQITGVSDPENPDFDILPFNTNLDLKIINPRTYEKTNNHKS